MKILQRYLAANFIPPFVLGTLFFVCFLLIFQLFRLIDLVISKSVQADVFLGMIFHTAVSFLPMAFPLASLFAALYTMNRLSEDSEIIAMRSFGLSKHKLVTPFVVVGLLIGTMIYTLNGELIPYSRSMFRNTLISLTSQGALADIRAEVFFTDIPRVTLFAQHVYDDGERMEEVFLRMEDAESGASERVIHAKRGALIKQSRGEWRSPQLRFYLEDGNMIRSNPETGELEKILFEEYDFPIAVGDFAHNFVAKDSMLTNAELQEEIQTFRKELANPKKKAQHDEIKQNYYRTKLEYWTRINTPFQCLLFVLLGFIFGVKRGRGQTGRLKSMMSMVSLLLYYIVFFVGMSFVKKAQLEPYVAVFAPTLLLGVLGTYFYHKMDWQ